MLSLGYGYLQISDIWDLTFAELLYMVDGKNTDIENDFKNIWEAARWSVYVLLQPHLKKNSHLRKPTDLIKFDWEKTKAHSKIDYEEIKRLEKLLEFEGKIIKDGIRKFNDKSRY